jgi:dTDP-4-dehydrorhamnose 3,5-epimerase
MKFLETNFSGLYIIEPNVLGDSRGWFMRTYSNDLFIGNINNINPNWVQMNHSFSEEKGTWRGFHFQYSPYQESKLIRCIRGKVLDCAIDLRAGSRTFLEIFQTELSSENKKMVFIPKGFAHGFLTLEDNSELIYLHDEYYHPEFESGINYKDPLINFDIKPKSVSERDISHKLLTVEFKGI